MTIPTTTACTTAAAIATSSPTATTSTTTTAIVTSTLPKTINVTVSSSTTNWYGYVDIFISCLTTLKNITIQIIVQKTVGATYSTAFSTFWGGTINQSYADNGTQIIYTWTIVSGQMIICSNVIYEAEAQFHLNGTPHDTSADTYMLTTTTNAGVTTTLSGHF